VLALTFGVGVLVVGLLAAERRGVDTYKVVMDEEDGGTWMNVLVAGATGALGRPLVQALVANGHEVSGLSRTPGNRDRLRALGAEPVIADVLDRAALLRAVDGLEADAVIHQLTSLKKIPMRHGDMALTNVLRTEGTANLLAAARVVGAHQFVTQSFIAGYGYYDHGARVLTENDPFAVPRHDRFDPHLAAMRSAEHQTFSAAGIEGIALRYGLFYGPGAGIEQMVDRLRRRRLPVPRDGGGVVSWIYIADAAAATVAALERGRPGQAYNIVDDEPVNWRQFIEALAAAFGAPRPLTVPRWIFRPAPYAYAMLTSTLRVSNAKAKRELGWAPSVPTYREGIRRTVQALQAAT
jgi:nucleoside-diphosphate-sugar epimerase